MSKTVDQRVVEMQFDNKQFEQGVSTTMSTLDKLKQKLDFSGASKGLNDLSAASKKVDMSGLASSVETVRAKFSALEVMGVTALANITNSAVNAGKQLLSSLTIDQIATGWSKYEQKTASVQTIMNATGKSIEEVNAYLEELMWYSDETSYGFTDMTNALATMTSSGGDIEKLIPLIEGVANATAFAGKGASEFSRVMQYAVNQAYSTGYMMSRDWSTIEGATVNSKQLIQTLIKAGEELGKIEKGSITLENFRTTLADKWLDTEVMEEGFGKFAELTQAAYEAVSSGEYDTASEAIAALADQYDEIATKAFTSAQEAKSFTEAIEATKDAVSSGWMNTMEIIFGNYEEAKVLWTDLSQYLWEVFASGAESRNAMLEEVMTSKWDQFVAKIEDTGISTDDFLDKLSEVAKENGIAVDDLIDKYGSLAKAIKAGKVPTNLFVKTLKKFIGAEKKVTTTTSELTDKLDHFQEVVNAVIKGDFGNGAERIEALNAAGENQVAIQTLVNKIWERNGHTWSDTTITVEDLAEVIGELSESELESMGYTEEEAKAIKELAEEAEKAGTPLSELIEQLDRPSGRDLLIDSFKNLAKAISSVVAPIKEAWNNTFSSFDGASVLYDLIDGFHNLTEAMIIDSGTADNFQRIFEGLFAAFQLSSGFISKSLTTTIKLLKAVLSLFGTDIMTVAGNIADYIVKIRDWVKEHTLLINSVDKVAQIIQVIIEGIHDCITAFLSLSKVTAFVSKITDAIGGFFEKIGLGIESIDFDGAIEAIRNFFSRIKEWINGLENSENLGRDIVLGLINGLKSGAATVATAIVDLAKSLFNAFCNFFRIKSPSRLMITVGGFIISGLIIGLLGSKTDLLSTFSDIASTCYEAVKGWFGNLAISAGSAWDKVIAVIKSGVQKIGAFLAGIDWGALIAAGLGVGTLVLGYKLVNVFEMLAKPLESLSGLLSAAKTAIANVGTAITKYYKAKTFDKIADGVLNMAIAVGILAASVWVLSKIPSEDLWRSVGAVAALVGVVAAFALISVLLGKIGGAGAQSLSLVAMAASILILAIALEKLSDIKIDDISTTLKLLGGMVGSMIALVAVFGIFCNSPASANMTKAGLMLIGMAVAMRLMVSVIKIAGNMDAGEVKNGLKVVGAVGLLFAALIAVSKLAGKNAAKAGTMLILMSVAFLAMLVVIKLASMLGMGEVKRGLAVIAVVGLLFTALIAVSNLAGKNATKAGAMILMMSLSLVMIIYFIKQVAQLDASELKQGLEALAAVGLIFAALIAVSKLAGKNAAKAGLMLLAMSAAMLILVGVIWLIGKMDPDELKQGLAVVVVLGLLMAGLIAVTKLASGVKLSVLITLVASIVLLATAIAVLSFIDSDRLVTATACLSAVILSFALLLASTKLVKDVSMKPILAMILVVAALAIIVGGLASIPNPDGVLPIVTALSILLLSFTASMVIIGKAGELSSDVTTSLIVLVVVIALLGGVILGLSYIPNPDTAIKMTGALIVLLAAFTAVTVVLAAMGKSDGAIKNAAKGAASLAIVVGIVSAMVVIIGVLMGLLSDEQMSAITTGLDRFVGMMSQMALLILAFIPVTAALALIGKFLGAGAAAQGALALVAVIAILGAVAVAIGSLMSLFTDEFFAKIETGLDRFTSVMIKIGEAIGGLIGGIIGGIAEGVLAGVGNGLTAFMENAQGFIEGCKAVDDSVLSGAGNLALAILALSGAELVASFTKLFGLSLPKLGSDLSLFMENMDGFIEASSSLNPEAMEGVKTLAEAIILLTGANLLDGLARFFGMGESSLGSFGEQFPILGEGIAGFMEALSGTDINLDTANAAAEVIKVLAQAANEIPNTGGLLADLVGDNDLATWAAQLPNVALGIAGFLENLGDFDDGKVALATSAAEVIKVLAQAASEIPNTGGLLADWIGDNDLSTWATQLPVVATGIVGFLSALAEGEFGDSDVKIAESAAEVIKVLAQAASDIPNTGGWLADLIGDNDLSTFASGLPQVGEGIAGFLSALAEGEFSEASVETARCAADVIKVLAEASESIDGQADWAKKIFGDNSISAFSEEFGTLGTNIATFATNLGEFSSKQVTTVEQAINAIKAFATLADADLKSAKNNLDDFGDKLPAFGTNITDFCANMPASDATATAITNLESVLQAIEDICAVDTKTFSEFTEAMGDAGTNAIKKFVSAFTSDDAEKDVKAAAEKLAAKAIDGIEAKEDDFEDACEDLGAKGPGGIKRDANYDDFKDAGKYLGDGLIEGINAKKDAVYKAAYALGQKAVQGEKDGQASNSPSKLTIKAGKWLGEGLVIGIKDMISEVYQSGSRLGNTAAESISNAVSNIASIVDSDIDAEPTIRPVLDLSDVETGVGAIGSMFSDKAMVGVTANVNAVNAMMSRRNQNGANDDIVSELVKLGDKLDNARGDTYNNINGLTYNDDTELSSAFETIIRYAKLERRS